MSERAPSAAAQLRKLLALQSSIAGLRDKVATFKQFTEIAGLPEMRKLEEAYGVPEDQGAEL